MIALFFTLGLIIGMMIEHFDIKDQILGEEDE